MTSRLKDASQTGTCCACGESICCRRNQHSRRLLQRVPRGSPLFALTGRLRIRILCAAPDAAPDAAARAANARHPSSRRRRRCDWAQSQSRQVGAPPGGKHCRVLDKAEEYEREGQGQHDAWLRRGSTAARSRVHFSWTGRKRHHKLWIKQRIRSAQVLRPLSACARSFPPSA
eukprot:scaffold121877_cov63-Phaeocystis_antarctica.AAC.3